MKRYKSKYSRPFEEEEEETTESETSKDDFEYKFEGYTIVLNEKIMLTPVQVPKPGKPAGNSNG
jgi:hypothetical protein